MSPNWPEYTRAVPSLVPRLYSLAYVQEREKKLGELESGNEAMQSVFTWQNVLVSVLFLRPRGHLGHCHHVGGKGLHVEWGTGIWKCGTGV